MSSNYSFTYVIGYRHNLERLQNLRRVLDWINCFAGVDVKITQIDTGSLLDPYEVYNSRFYHKTVLRRLNVDESTVKYLKIK